MGHRRSTEIRNDGRSEKPLLRTPRYPGEDRLPLHTVSCDFRRPLPADDTLGHLIAAEIGRRRDALNLQLELVRVGRPAQRLVVGDDPLPEQTENRLIERLHAVLRRAGGDRAVNEMPFVLVDDAIADEGGGDHYFYTRRTALVGGSRHPTLGD